MDGMILTKSSWSKPGVSLIAKALDAAEDGVRLVGGAVRDGLAGLPVKDIDLATRFTPDEVISKLAKAGLKTVPTGIAHGTVSAVLDWGTVEVTTLRRDVSTDGRRATVAFSDDWQEDAARRDFTVNALYADLLTGQVHDYFGGVGDLNAGIVRFIGDPLTRIAEDHLRILRFFRFQARFGKGPPDPAGLAACAERSNDLMALSRERIADELLKLLDLPKPADAVAIMLKHALLKPVLPEVIDDAADQLTILCQRERHQEFPPDPLRRLAAMLPADVVTVAAVGARLKLSNKARKRLEAVAARGPKDASNPEALAYWEGVEVAIDRILLGSGNAAALTDWSPPVFPVSGKHLIKRGLPPGPRVAALLKEVERQWVSEAFPNRDRVDEMLVEAMAKES